MRGARWTKVVHVTTAIVLAVSLVVLGAVAADRYRLPFIHSWALTHGTFMVVFPAYFVLFYLLLHPVARRIALRYSATSIIRDQRVSKLAVWSLLSSGLGFLAPVVGSGIGVLLGHMARRRCRENPELYGAGIALAGLIAGYVGLVMMLYVFGALAWGYFFGYGG